jgi:branched-chain amino acid transport system permease protein
MEYFAQQILNGLILGAIYGLIAIGYTMVYGIAGMINFAHGDIFMMASFSALIVFLVAATLYTGLPIAILILLMLLVSMLVVSLWSRAIERVAYRPLRNSFRLAPLITAIGTSIVLSNFIQVTQGPRNKPIPQVLHELAYIGGMTISYMQMTIIAVTALLLPIFWLLVSKTRLGRNQRATEQDRKMAALVGIDVDRTISLTFVLGASLAAVAGTLYLLFYGVASFSDGFIPGIKAFTAAVLGGIGSLPGAVLGGLFIGLIEALWSGYFTIAYKDVATFAILAFVLIFKPTGLLGQTEVEKI